MVRFFFLLKSNENNFCLFSPTVFLLRDGDSLEANLVMATLSPNDCSQLTNFARSDTNHQESSIITTSESLIVPRNLPSDSAGLIVDDSYKAQLLNFKDTTQASNLAIENNKLLKKPTEVSTNKHKLPTNMCRESESEDITMEICGESEETSYSIAVQKSVSTNIKQKELHRIFCSSNSQKNMGKIVAVASDEENIL